MIRVQETCGQNAGSRTPASHPRPRSPNFQKNQKRVKFSEQIPTSAITAVPKTQNHSVSSPLLHRTSPTPARSRKFGPKQTATRIPPFDRQTLLASGTFPLKPASKHLSLPSTNRTIAQPPVKNGQHPQPPRTNLGPRAQRHRNLYAQQLLLPRSSLRARAALAVPRIPPGSGLLRHLLPRASLLPPASALPRMGPRIHGTVP